MNAEKPMASIMIVDDEPENLNVLEALLTQAGYRVAAFPRGELALAAARHAAAPCCSHGYSKARGGQWEGVGLIGMAG